MKDEELAEEYICNGKCQDDITRNYVHCKTCTRLKDFLAGLKAGRQQWHDLRKDPKDLPKDNRIVSDQEGNNVKYVDRLNKWFYRHRTCEANVYAWCEIPTFDKE